MYRKDKFIIAVVLIISVLSLTFYSYAESIVEVVEETVVNDNFDLPDGLNTVWNISAEINNGAMKVDNSKSVDYEYLRILPATTGYVTIEASIMVEGYKGTHYINVYDRLEKLFSLSFNVEKSELNLIGNKTLKLSLPAGTQYKSWFKLVLEIDTLRGKCAVWTGEKRSEFLNFVDLIKTPDNGVNRIGMVADKGIEGTLGFNVDYLKVKKLPYLSDDEFYTLNTKMKRLMDVYGTEFEEAVLTLMGLGIIENINEDLFLPNSIISRGEFAQMAARLTGLDVNSEKEDEDGFTDISSSDYIYPSVMALYNAGIVSGGTFRPNDVIKPIEALKIAVDLLGYSNYAKERGGYPEGYSITASMIGLKLKNKTNTLTRGDAARLIYDVLNTKYASISSVSHNKIAYDAKGEVLSEKVLKLKKIEGIVTANRRTSLMTSSPTNEDYIMIDDKQYKVGKTNAVELLGYYVNAYVDDEDVIRCINAFTNENEELHISFDDIIKDESADSVIKYKNEDGKLVLAHISPVAYFVFNGKRIEYNTSLFSSLDYGNIKLVENKSQSGYDTIFIESLENIVVDAVSEYSKTIMVKDGYGSNLVLDDVDEWHLTKGGQSVSLSEIKEWNVITLIRSVDGQYVKGEVSDIVINGVVDEIDFEDHRVLINGKQYKCADNIIGNLSLGENATFYLDANKRVVAKKLKSDELYYGYLFEIAKPRGLGDSLQIKLFGSDGKFKTYETESKCLFNGKSERYTDIYTYLTSTSSNNERVVNRQLIRFKVKEEDVIHDIWTASGDAFIIPNENPQIFNLSSSISNGKYRVQNDSFSDSVYMTSDTVIFRISGDESVERNYDIVPKKDLVADLVLPGLMTGYDADDFLSVKTVLVKSTTADGGVYVPEKLSSFIIEKVTSGADGEKILYGLKNGKSSRISILEDDLIKVSDSNGRLKLSSGDYIQIKRRNDGSFEGWHDLFDIKLLENGKAYSNSSFYVQRDVFYGDILKVDYSSRKLLVRDNGGLKMYPIAKAANVYTYDIKNKKLSNGNFSDIVKDSFIVFRINVCEAYDIMVIRNIDN